MSDDGMRARSIVLAYGYTGGDTASENIPPQVVHTTVGFEVHKIEGNLETRGEDGKLPVVIRAGLAELRRRR